MATFRLDTCFGEIQYQVKLALWIATSGRLWDGVDNEVDDSIFYSIARDLKS